MHRFKKKQRLLREMLLSILLFLVFIFVTTRLELFERLYVLEAHLLLPLGDVLLALLLFFPCYTAIFAWRRLSEINLLVQEASVDSLTGLYNRRNAFEALNREVQRAQRTQSPLSVIIFDIDYFKQVNDTYGHPTGDAVLTSFAECLSSGVRQIDYLSRMGGEEFLLIAPETSGPNAVELAERLRNKVASRNFGLAIPVTASFGVSQLRAGEDFHELLQRADERLYWAKRNGRNRVVGPEKAGKT